ncbi:hypothetical protein NDU88_000740 [Pleurodeles waltl]|uniref:Uncharacterized protein n=1 Tax=Pleurodeles waltl TaxID=8319 RepID=A0AAV7VZ26_PLEWA|nr:hypothetical protein NDU88_000740 [Pleurodeles waltl]
MFWRAVRGKIEQTTVRKKLYDPKPCVFGVITQWKKGKMTTRFGVLVLVLAKEYTATTWKLPEEPNVLRMTTVLTQWTEIELETLYPGLHICMRCRYLTPDTARGMLV